MDGKYHIQLCEDALGDMFGAQALATIAKADTGQDSLIGLLFHPEYHSEDLAQAQAYIQGQRGVAIDAAKHGTPDDARRAFGRLLHAAQDFYAHTNYVRLWAEHYNEEDLPPVKQFDGLNASLLRDERLFACNTYLVRDYLYFVPFLRGWILTNIPEDSHAHMNLDNPGQGPLFDYAMAGARQASQRELHAILDALTPDEQARFLDRHAA